MGSLLVQSVVLSALLCCSFAANLISQDRLLNCNDAVPGDPCVLAALGDSVQPLFNGPVLPAPCAEALDGTNVAVSDYRGLTIRPTSDLATLSHDVPLSCHGKILAGSAVSDRYYWAFNSASFGFTDVGTCNCEKPGNCTRSVLFDSSSGSSRLSPSPPLTIWYSPNQNSVESDILHLPIVPMDCSGDPSTWYWLNQALIDNPDSVLFRYATGECALDFLTGIPKTAENVGYKYYLLGTPTTAGYRNLATRSYPTSMLIFVLEQSDSLFLVDELTAGHNLTMSFGPSFRTSVSTTGDPPAGLSSIDISTGLAESNTTAFKFASSLVAEASVGGRANILWAAGTSRTPEVVRIDASDPLSPVYTFFTDSTFPDFDTLDPAQCPSFNVSFLPWRGTGDFPFGCNMLSAKNASFTTVFTEATKVQSQASIAMFSEGGSTYALLAARLDVACPSCLLGSGLASGVVDLWDLTSTPSLLDRVTYDRETAVPVFLRYWNGYAYYSYQNDERTVRIAPVDASLKLTKFEVTANFTDSNVPADAVLFDRRIYQGKLVNSFGKYGTIFYNIDNLGYLSENTTIASGVDAAGDVESGALINCGDITFVQNNGLKAVTPGVGGLYDYVDLQAYDVFASQSSASTSSSTTSSTTSSSSTTTGTSSGSVPSPSPAAAASPSSGPASCVNPEGCMIDCSKPDAPSKLPKPSTNPSKLPNPTKVAPQTFFTVQLTYESTPAECGAGGPDCCDVRSVLGDDAVAASFLLCGSDSTTKNRPPTYDSKSGTCSIFLAAAEGSNLGQITQAEFDAAIATLEGNFDVLCPGSAKNCKVKTSSGQTYAYVLGSAAQIAAGSLILIAAALAALM